MRRRQIPDKGSEITELARWWPSWTWPALWSPSSLHTQRTTAKHLVGVTNADYIMTIKANQPRLLAIAQQALSDPSADSLTPTVRFLREI